MAGPADPKLDQVYAFKVRFKLKISHGFTVKHLSSKYYQHFNKYFQKMQLFFDSST